MVNAVITKPDALNQFIDRYSDNRYCLEVLHFFGIHPYARFNRPAVTHSLNGNGHRYDVERALEHLVSQGVVKASLENNTYLYSLTKDESIRTRVLEMARLEWYQWLTIIRRAEGGPA